MPPFTQSQEAPQQPSPTSIPIVPPRAPSTKMTATAAARQSRGGSLDGKSPPFMAWNGEVMMNGLPPDTAETIGSSGSSLQTVGSFGLLAPGGPHAPPSPLQVATVERTGDLIQRHAQEAPMNAFWPQTAPNASPAMWPRAEVKSNGGSFTAAPFMMAGQAERMHLAAPGTNAVTATVHPRAGSSSPDPRRPGASQMPGMPVVQGCAAVRFASPVPPDGMAAPRVAAASPAARSPANSRVPSPLAPRMDWATGVYQPSALQSDASALRSQRAAPRISSLQ